MTILYIVTQGETGGAQNYVTSLARAVKGQNMTVNVAIGEKGDNWLGNEIEAMGGRIWLLSRLRRAISPTNDILAVLELAKLYRNIKPDVIHLNSSKAGVLGSLAAIIYRAKSKKCKILYTAHGWVFNEDMPTLKKMMYISLEKLTAKAKDEIICVSEYDRNTALIKKIASPEKFVTIHNGINAEGIELLDKESARKEIFGADLPSQDEIIIGCIANFYPTKGLEYLIDAIKIISQTTKIRLVIIGDGDLRPKLEKQIRFNGLESIVLLVGKKKNAQRYLAAFDLAVMSSVKEGFPYFLLEAMSAGLPIVATRVGGIPEIVDDNKTGLLIEPKNPKDLAEKILRLANDHELRIKLGRAGMEKIKKEFSEVEMINKTLKAYHN